MDFTALKAAVAARGFDDLTDAQLGQLVNDAVAELDSMVPWPYREASSTGAAPLTITDLGEIDVVLALANSSFPLERATRSELSGMYGDLTTGGTPVWWYLSGSAVAVYPASTGQITVRYWKTTPTLSGGSDTPLAPARWHNVYVDIAAGAGYPDGETPPGLQARIDRRVGVMINALMPDSGPTFVGADGVDG